MIRFENISVDTGTGFALKNLSFLVPSETYAVLMGRTGCGKTTLSPDAYQLVSAIDRIFEKRDPQQLKQASDKISEELAAGKITADEAKLLDALIAKAENKNWDTASKDARQLLADQTDW